MTYNRLDTYRPTLKELQDAWLNNILTDEEHDSKVEAVAEADATDITEELGDELVAYDEYDDEVERGSFGDILEAITEKDLTYAARTDGGQIVLIRTDDDGVFTLKKAKKTYTVYGNVVTPFSYTVEAYSEDEAREIVEDADPCDFDYDNWGTTVDITDVEED